VLNELLVAIRDVVRITFVTPVKEGRPHPSAWPRGLREVGTGTAVVFALLALSIVFSGPLRQYGTLTLSSATANGVPELTLPLLLTGTLLSFALIITAALHTSWWLRISLLGIGGAAVVFFTAQAWTSPLLIAVSALAFLALVGFTIVRSFRSYAWWEFVVVAVLVMLATLTPMSQPLPGASVGFDFRPTALYGALVSLQPLVVPAVMVAGSAPAQIVVTGAQATADRPVGRGLFWTGFTIAVVWLVVATYLALGGRELTTSALLASAVLLAAIAAMVAVLVRRAGARVPPPPEIYPEVWGGWLYPLAAVVAAIAAVSVPVLIVRGIFELLGQTAVVDAISFAWNAFNDNNPSAIWRAVLGAVTLAMAWRLAARNRLAEAVVLASFAILVLGDAFGQLPGFSLLQDRTTTALGLLAAVVALIAAAFLAARGRLDRVRAVGVLTVVLLAVLYPNRNLLEDPTSVLVVLAPTVLLVFGLAWRVVTEAQVTYTGSRSYPQSTRVLLFLANTLFATTSVAYVALAKAAGTDLDPSDWGALGDTVLGDPLFATGLVTGLWLLLRPPARQVQEPLPQPSALF
jgi:hypothetical protein